MTSVAQLRLASASPRRRELLASIGVQVEVAPVNIDETPHTGESAEAYVARLAIAKALAGVAQSGSASASAGLPTLGSDTAVVCEGRILGKPEDEAHAFAMLKSLSARRHEVLTSVAVAGPQGTLETTVVTAVHMREISDAEISAYWRTGEPVDKAGGYAIQGLASVFVTRIEGSYSAVVGLPLFETAQLLARQGVTIWHD
ncbi:Maf family protein [Halomonas cupida]|nr:Maf family protein [Halomonas cupida]SHM33006.1 septum formation protein [Halomonas cupida]